MSEFVVYDNGNHMVSQSGIVKNVWGDTIEPYISSSNMLYVPYTFEGNITRLKRLDLIVANMFNQVPDELVELPLTLRHIDNDMLNVNSDNLEWIEDVEEWKTSSFLEGYYVSSWGRIRSPHNGIIKGTIRDGYLVLTINHAPGSGKPRSTYLLHRIVALLFIGDISEKVVNHIDGIRANPRWDNLEIVTSKENNEHAVISGMHGVGDEVYRLIDKYLFINDGAIMKTVRNMRELGFSNVTDTIVQNRKNKLVSQGEEFGVKHNRKLDDPNLVRLIKDLLIQYEGHVMSAYNIIKDEFSQITPSNIGTVKVQMSNDGYHFKNGRLNRKISEEERKRLIRLLEINNWSVSKTYKQISDLDEFKHVSVYDIKYLKRKYGVT